MLKSKDRARLRALANGMDAIVHIGKEGITEGVLAQADDALRARSLVKLRVLETAGLSPREACDGIAKAIPCEPVQVIGSKFVLYRHDPEKPLLETK